MTEPLEQLRAVATELHALQQVVRLLEWDQQTVMPPAGVSHRPSQLGALERLIHERLTSTALERLLDAVVPTEGQLDPGSDDACLIRWLRRKHERAVQVPVDLRVAMTSAAAEGTAIWVEAKTSSDFKRFLPSLQRNVELRREYSAVLKPDEPYDALVQEYEPELTAEVIGEIFDRVRHGIPGLIAEASNRSAELPDLDGPFHIEGQAALAKELIELFGHRADSFRIDPTVHPFHRAIGRDDIRVTTHYAEHDLHSLFSAMHEYGHGLYEHQSPYRLAHLPIGSGASPVLHESQSRLWENVIGRGEPFWSYFYPRLQATFPERLGGVDLARFIATINRVRPSVNRVRADEVTYPMHIVVRFELEQELIGGQLEPRNLPMKWAAKMQEYLGVEVYDDGQGVLQDVHWAHGLMGYFPTYLLGSILSAQLWEKLTAAVPAVEEEIRSGRFVAVREWLGANLHTHGSKFPTLEALQVSFGAALEVEPYIAYLSRRYGLSGSTVSAPA